MSKSKKVTVTTDVREIRTKITEELRSALRLLSARKPHVIVSDQVSADFTIWAPHTLARAGADGINGIVIRSLLDAHLRSERMAPGSGEATVYLTAALTSEIMENLLATGSDGLEVEELLQNDLRALENSSPYVTMDLTGEFLQGRFKQLSFHPGIWSLAWEAVALGGAGSQLVVSSNRTPSPTISLAEGFTFPLGGYHEIVGERAWEASDVRLALIDGIIERPSEIHGLLERAALDKLPLIIFARGFSEDTVATLTVNMARRTLNVMPIRVPFDQDSANTLNDIAAVASCDVTSALKGDLIESITFESLPVIKSVRVTSRGTTLVPQERSLRLQAHVNELKRRRSSADEALLPIFDARIRSLTARSVTVTLNEELARFEKNLDFLFHYTKACVRGGVVDISQGKSSGILGTAISSLSMSFPCLPATHFKAALLCSCSAALSILSIQGMILLDEP
jgi:hypothetical protein